jgi:hypothetical protein
MAGESLEEFVASLGDKVLHCRELGHSWRPLTVSWDAEAQAYDRRLRCPSCRTVRVQLLSQHGHVLGNRYIYPEGYLAHGITVGQGRDHFRLESLQRFLATTPTTRSRKGMRVA